MFLYNKNSLTIKNKEVLMESNNIEVIWEQIYFDYFSLNKKFNLPSDYIYKKDHLIIFKTKDLTNYKLVEALRKKIKICSFFENNNPSIIEDYEDFGDYLAIFDNEIEPDLDLANISISEFVNKKSVESRINFSDRLLLEIFVYSQRKKHLDIKNATLCSGSFVRNSKGIFIPSIYWDFVFSRLDISLFPISGRGSNIMSREVIKRYAL